MAMWIFLCLVMTSSNQNYLTGVRCGDAATIMPRAPPKLDLCQHEQACLGVVAVAAAAPEGSAATLEAVRLATVFLAGEMTFLAGLGAGLLLPDFRSL